MYPGSESHAKQNAVIEKKNSMRKITPGQIEVMTNMRTNALKPEKKGFFTWKNENYVEDVWKEIH